VADVAISRDQHLALESRVSTLENKNITQEIEIAVLKSNQKEVDKKLDKIDNNISKLTWIVISAVVLAILNSVFDGGIHI
jgi:uncharacterized coiled-coil protein SlyX